MTPPLWWTMEIALDGRPNKKIAALLESPCLKNMRCLRPYSHERADSTLAKDMIGSILGRLRPNTHLRFE